MPVLLVLGLSEASESDLENLRLELKRIVASIAELEIEPNHVTVRFLAEKADDTGEVIIFVQGLNKMAKRTRAVRDRMAQVIQHTIAEFYAAHFMPEYAPEYILIECFVMPYAIGFSTNQE